MLIVNSYMNCECLSVINMTEQLTRKQQTRLKTVRLLCLGKLSIDLEYFCQKILIYSILGSLCLSICVKTPNDSRVTKFDHLMDIVSLGTKYLT